MPLNRRQRRKRRIQCVDGSSGVRRVRRGGDTCRVGQYGRWQRPPRSEGGEEVEKLQESRTWLSSTGASKMAKMLRQGINGIGSMKVIFR